MASRKSKKRQLISLAVGGLTAGMTVMVGSVFLDRTEPAYFFDYSVSDLEADSGSTTNPEASDFSPPTSSSAPETVSPTEPTPPAMSTDPTDPPTDPSSIVTPPTTPPTTTPPTTAPPTSTAPPTTTPPTTAPAFPTENPIALPGAATVIYYPTNPRQASLFEVSEERTRSWIMSFTPNADPAQTARDLRSAASAAGVTITSDRLDASDGGTRSLVGKLNGWWFYLIPDGDSLSVHLIAR